MHFVCGADWSEQGAGTNALGTAIAVDHPVQIFSAEHFNRIVHPWQCSGAPIHDPATGEILGRHRSDRAPAHRPPAHAVARDRGGRDGRGVPAPRSAAPRRGAARRPTWSGSPASSQPTALVRPERAGVIVGARTAGSPTGSGPAAGWRADAARRRDRRRRVAARASTGSCCGAGGPACTRPAGARRCAAGAVRPPPADRAGRADRWRCRAATRRSSRRWRSPATG